MKNGKELFVVREMEQEKFNLNQLNYCANE